MSRQPAPGSGRDSETSQGGSPGPELRSGRQGAPGSRQRAWLGAHVAALVEGGAGPSRTPAVGLTGEQRWFGATSPPAVRAGWDGSQGPGTWQSQDIPPGVEAECLELFAPTPTTPHPHPVTISACPGCLGFFAKTKQDTNTQSWKVNRGSSGVGLKSRPILNKGASLKSPFSLPEDGEHLFTLKV